MDGRTDALSAQLAYYKNLEDARADVVRAVREADWIVGE